MEEQELPELDYHSVLEMLKSDDRENRTIAFSIIDNVSFDDNFVKMLLLKKRANIDYSEWRDCAPITAKQLKLLYENLNLLLSEPMTYLNMIRILKESKKAKRSEIRLFLEESFKDYLTLTDFDEPFHLTFDK